MNNKINVLCKYLKQEINWIIELNTLLVEEKELLETRQFIPLEEYADKKQELSILLEESAKQRMILIDCPNQDPAAALKDFLSEATTEELSQVNQLNSTLAEKLTICRELNSVNGQVIANNLYIRQEIMNTLSGTNAEAISTYNAHGNLQSSTDNRHHQEA